MKRDIMQTIRVCVTTERETAPRGETVRVTIWRGDWIPMTEEFALAAARSFACGWDTDPGPRSTRMVTCSRMADGAKYEIELFTPSREVERG